MKIFGVVGWKNSGKTGLMERLIAELTRRGYSVSTVKHAHHRVDVDQPGKDSHRHREAGARQVLLASSQRWALMHELRAASEPPLEALLARLDPVDLVLIEGYKRDAHPKIEAYRLETETTPLALEDPSVLAVASDAPLPAVDRPRFDLDDTAAIADFLLEAVGLARIRPAPVPAAAEDAGREADVSVEQALSRLRAALAPIAEHEDAPLSEAAGRFLAAAVRARRDNPPVAQSAVDGYALAGAGAAFTLLEGRAAAGAPYAGRLAPGTAVRALTGAMLPEGADRAAPEEIAAPDGPRLRIAEPVPAGANIRQAGEDAKAGEVALPAGRRLRPQDLGLLAAIGVERVPTCRRLRVGVLSTGDELRPPGAAARADQIYDADRPMLLSLVADWGYAAEDLGWVGDDAAALRARLDQAAEGVDVILTSGGASAGEADHVSAALRREGRLLAWRVAMKPGRPVALGFWRGTPILALPGNPAAAFVCALIFAAPALRFLAGGAWRTAEGFWVPAAFAKEARRGRREYLRARLNAEGAAEIFTSDSSGRLSGLSWSEGLALLGDEVEAARPGDLVRYLPYALFRA